MPGNESLPVTNKSTIDHLIDIHLYCETNQSDLSGGKGKKLLIFIKL